MNDYLTIAAPLVAMRLQIARACGIDTALVLKQVGLHKATLLNPMARLTLAQDNAVWRSIVALIGDEAIGLKFGRYIKLSGIGVVGYMMMNTGTVVEGLRRFCKYEPLLTNIYRSEMVSNSDGFTHIIHCEGAWQPERRYTLDSIVSAGRYLAADRALDRQSILQVQFQYDRPGDLAPYAEVFGTAQLKFGCPDTRLIFAGQAAKTPVIGANPDLLATFEQQAEMLLAKYERDNFSDRVRQEILGSLKGETPALSAIAARLHLSSRNLQLKLQQEGTSFQTLLDEVRRYLAIAYLQNSNLSKTEIAFLLGFSEPSVFSRRCKLWTGKSPSAFQKENVRSH